MAKSATEEETVVDLRMDPVSWLRKQVEEADVDLLREMVRVGAPGAKYLISVPDAASERFQQPFAHASYFAAPNHVRIIEPRELESVMETLRPEGLCICTGASSIEEADALVQRAKALTHAR